MEINPREVPEISDLYRRKRRFRQRNHRTRSGVSARDRQTGSVSKICMLRFTAETYRVAWNPVKLLRAGNGSKGLVASLIFTNFPDGEE